MLLYANRHLNFLFEKRDLYTNRSDLIDHLGLNKDAMTMLVQNRLGGTLNVASTIQALYKYITSRGVLYLTNTEASSVHQETTTPLKEVHVRIGYTIIHPHSNDLFPS